MKEALKQFATEARLKELEDIIETTLRPLLRPEDVPEPQGDEPGPTGDDDTDALLQEQLQAWEEGTEEYATWSREKLMEMLGLTGLQTDTFPYFNRTCDRTSAKRSAWDSDTRPDSRFIIQPHGSASLYLQYSPSCEAGSDYKLTLSSPGKKLLLRNCMVYISENPQKSGLQNALTFSLIGTVINELLTEY